MGKQRRNMGGVSWTETGPETFKLCWRQNETLDGDRAINRNWSSGSTY